MTHRIEIEIHEIAYKYALCTVHEGTASNFAT